MTASQPLRKIWSRGGLPSSSRVAEGLQRWRPKQRLQRFRSWSLGAATRSRLALSPVSTGRGGNITGVTSLLSARGGKQLGLLRELVPKANVIGLLMNPNEPTSESQVGDVQAAAREIGAQLIVLRASTERDIDAAFATLVQQRAGALILGISPLFVTQADKLIALAARHTRPVMYFRREFATARGLWRFGPDTDEYYRLLCVCAGRILKGEKPADLPVVQSTKFELVINLKTAKALGIDVPTSMQLLADEVIE